MATSEVRHSHREPSPLNSGATSSAAPRSSIFPHCDACEEPCLHLYDAKRILGTAENETNPSNQTPNSTSQEEKEESAPRPHGAGGASVFALCRTCWNSRCDEAPQESDRLATAIRPRRQDGDFSSAAPETHHQDSNSDKSTCDTTQQTNSPKGGGSFQSADNSTPPEREEDLRDEPTVTTVPTDLLTIDRTNTYTSSGSDCLTETPKGSAAAVAHSLPVALHRGSSSRNHHRIASPLPPGSDDETSVNLVAEASLTTVPQRGGGHSASERGNGGIAQQGKAEKRPLFKGKKGSGDKNDDDNTDADNNDANSSKKNGSDSSDDDNSSASPTMLVTGGAHQQEASAEFPHQPAEPETLSESTISARRKVLLLMCALKILTSYDSGAFSAVLGIEDGISDELRLSVVDDGALGSIVFLGNTIGCAVAGFFFERYKAQNVLAGAMALHLVSTFIFAAATSLEVLFAARVVIGVSLAFVVVYSIVWIDAFAPKDRATTWMAMVNIGVPVGTLIGFVVGGAILARLGLSWRWAFFFKVVAMAPAVAILATMDGTNINERRKKQQHLNAAAAATASKPSTPTTTTNGSAAATTDQPPSTPSSDGGNGRNLFSFERALQAALSFLRNRVFMATVSGLTVLYFVVTALQTFMTPYLRAPPFNASMNAIVFGFGTCAVTAPVVGVIMGGLTMDRLGGYHSDLGRAAKFVAVLATLGAVFSVLCIFMKTTFTFLFMMWMMLFVGGAILPAATGMLMAVVSPEDRSAASSFANITFNIFGYFLGPLFCGYVANALGSLESGLEVTLFMTAVGGVCFWAGVYFAKVDKGTLPSGEVGPSSNSQSPVVVATNSAHSFNNDDADDNATIVGERRKAEAKLEKVAVE